MTDERSAFEPHDEDAFLTAVRAAFPEDASAQLEKPIAEAVLVENRDSGLRYHRRWGWWTMGALGMAATISDLWRPESYSLADVSVDLGRFLGLVDALGIVGRARLLFDLAPSRLRVEWDLSSPLTRGVAGARLDGAISVACPQREEVRRCTLEHEGTLESFEGNKDSLLGELLWFAMKDLHGPRIDKRRLIASIPAAISASERARAL